MFLFALAISLQEMNVLYWNTWRVQSHKNDKKILKPLVQHSYYMKVDTFNLLSLWIVIFIFVPQIYVPYIPSLGY